jgi:hypothetical protein
MPGDRIGACLQTKIFAAAAKGFAHETMRPSEALIRLRAERGK